LGELNLRDKFLAAARESKPYYETLEVPGFGIVYVKKLGVGERDQFDPKLNKPPGTRTVCLLHCCFDDRGLRIFEDSDTDLIAQLDPDIIDPIVTKALELNGLREGDREQLAKNLNGQPGNSSSG
jgi:hypothetical protein